MSLTVKHINGDSSFLLLFSPDSQPSSNSPTSPSATFSILVDPWIEGPSVVAAPWFAITRRVVPACIQHLSELEEPDVVIVSLNKPDHCHRDTLIQLRPDAKTIIAAEPAAAKTIKSWDHFDPARVQSLPKYNPQKRFSSATFHVPSQSPEGNRGVITVSLIPAKNSMTGLHNAIGITYLAPTYKSSMVSTSTESVRDRTKFFHLPPSPALYGTWPARDATSDSERNSTFQRKMTAGDYSTRNWPTTSPTAHSPNSSYEFQPILPSNEISPASALSSTFGKSASDNSPTSYTSIGFQDPRKIAQPLPTPPESPYSSSSIPSFAQQTSPLADSFTTSTSGKNISNGRPRVLSVLYSPHGIPFSPDLMPYVRSHLVPRGALPLTVLLHSFVRANNPWYLGGNIMTGAAGGVEIARSLKARCWISAHDEDKDNQGVSVKQLKMSRKSPEEVRRALWDGPEGERLRQSGWTCDVRNLAAGEEMAIGQSGDSVLGGMEHESESQLMTLIPTTTTTTTTTTKIPPMITTDVTTWRSG